MKSWIVLTVVLGWLWACDQGGDSLPSGMIAMFEEECPNGWTHYSLLDERFPRGNSQAGALGGEVGHAHSFDLTARTSKDGAHIHMLARGETVSVDSGKWGHVGILDGYIQGFEQAGRQREQVSRARAITDEDGVHDHLISISGDLEELPHLPPYVDLVFCKKD